MRHPIEECNVNQAAILTQLPAGQREYMARMFRIGNASYCYHNRVKELAAFGQSSNDLPIEAVASPEDLPIWLERQLLLQNESRSARELLFIYFEEYLEGLPYENVRNAERARGLDEAKRSFSFRRYVLERHDIGMNEFLKMNLSAEDYAFHVKCGKPLREDDESAE